MVLAQPVGRKRSFASGLLLTILTLGVYAVYWNYRAHNELYRQFELDRENRDEGMGWYVLGLVVPPLLLGYLWVMARNVDYLRQRIGLPTRQTSGRFLGLVGVAAGCLATATILFFLLPVETIEGETYFQEGFEEQGVAMLIIALSLMGLAALLLAIWYAGMQADMNGLWDAYHARTTFLLANPHAALPPPSVAPAGGLFDRVAAGVGGAHAPTYYADLRPPSAPAWDGATAPAAPAAALPQPPAGEPAPALPPPAPAAQAGGARLTLWDEYERLRASETALELPTLEALLLAAQNGDPYALERAQALLEQARALVAERDDLARRKESLIAQARDLDERLARRDLDEAAHERATESLERDLDAVRARLEDVEARLFEWR